MGNNRGMQRYRRLQYVVLIAAIAILGRLFYVQIIDDRYKALAEANIMRVDIDYPMRGEVLDRRGEFLIRSRVCYDVMVITRDIPREGFDSVRLATILNISMDKLRRELRRAGPNSRQPHLVVGYLSQEAKLILDESDFKGFYTRFRTAREYPRQVGGNLLGYVSEVDQRQVDIGCGRSHCEQISHPFPTVNRSRLPCVPTYTSATHGIQTPKDFVL